METNNQVSNENEKLSPFVKKMRVSDSPYAPVTQPQPGLSGEAHNAKKSLFASESTDSCQRQPPDQAPEWFTRFEATLTRLDSRMDILVQRINNKLQEHEEKIQHLEFASGKIEEEVKKLKLENADLRIMIDDLENRSRRKNLVIFGLQESSREDPLKSVTEFLKFAGVEERDISAIERCHRTPGGPPRGISQHGPNPKPRMIHVGFATFVAKERCRKACIQKLKSATYGEQKLFIAEDLSKRVVKLRKEKMAEFSKMKKEGKRPFFVFPAKLCYREGDKLVSVESALHNK